MADKKLQSIINIKRGDVSGLKVGSEAAEIFERAKTELAEIARIGGVGAVAIGSDQVAHAERNLDGLETQARLLESQLLNTAAAMLQLDPNSRAFQEAAERAAGLYNELVRVNAEAAKLPSNVGKAGQVNFTQAQGDLSSTFSAISGFAGGLGVDSSITGGLQLSSDFTGVVEYLPRFAEGLKVTGDTLKNTGGIVGQLASIGAAAAAPLGATAAGLGAILGVAAPVALALGGIALIMGQIQAAIAEAKREAENYVSAQREVAELIGEGATSNQASQQASELQRLVEAREAVLAPLEDFIASNPSADLTDLGSQLSEWLNQAAYNLGLSEDAKARLQQEIEALTGGQITSLTGLQAAVDGERAAIDGLIADQNELTDAINAGAFAANDAAEALRQQIQSEIQGIRARADAQSQATELISTGNASALQQLIDSSEAQRLSILDQIAQLEQLENGGELAAAEIAALNEELRNAEVAAGVYREALPRAEDMQAVIEAQQFAVDAIRERAANEVELARLINQASSETIQQQRDATEIQLRALREQASALRELQTLAGNDAATAALEETNAQITELTNTLNVLNQAEPAVRIRELAQAQQEVEAAEIEHGNNVAKLRQQALNEIEQIEVNRARAEQKAFTAREQAFTALIAKTNDAVQTENREYMQSEIKAFEQFRNEELRATSQHNKERLRLLSDINNSLLEAEENNDIIAFVQAKRRGEEQLRRQSEDAEEETRTRIDNFLAQRQAEEQAHNARLAQIETQAATERAAIQTRYAEQVKAADDAAREQTAKTRAALDERIKLEQAALQRVIASINEKYNLEVAAHGKAVDQKTQAEIKGVNAVTSAISSAFNAVIQQAQAAARTAQQQAQQAAQYANSNVTSRGSFGAARQYAPVASGGLRVRAFAEGGIVPAGREVVGYFEPNRDYAEGVIPLTSDAIRNLLPPELFQSRTAAASVVFSPQFSFGDFNLGAGVTPADVKAAVEQMGMEVAQGLYEARMGVQP